MLTFLKTRLAPYKVPRYVAFVGEVPKNSVGKIVAQEANVSDMCVKAARSCIQGILEPEELDLIIYHGSEYRDYYLYNCSAQLQHKLGAKNAKTFELHNLCSSGPLAMQLAKSVMFVHPEISLLPSRSGMTRSMTISTLPIPEITGFRCSPPAGPGL